MYWAFAGGNHKDQTSRYQIPFCAIQNLIASHPEASKLPFFNSSKSQTMQELETLKAMTQKPVSAGRSCKIRLLSPGGNKIFDGLGLHAWVELVSICEKKAGEVDI